MHGEIGKGRRRERGVTILITAVAMVVMLAMAALAIDVVTLYLASGEAQKNADAAALAGAKAFVSSGFTSGQLGDPTTGAAQTQVCNGSTGLADYQAQAAAQKNLIAGTVPTTVTTACPNFFLQGENPQITVTVTRTGLPTFFARIWGAGASSVSATSKAEAYNPSGSTTVPIQVHSVKPWLIPNCIPSSPPPCVAANTIVDPTANYALHNTALYIGQFFTFYQSKVTPYPNIPPYFALDLVPQATDCPSSSAAPAGSCNQLGSTAYHDNIACANTALTLSCGDTVTIDPNTDTPAVRTKTREGIQCLIHTTEPDRGNPNPPPTSCATDSDPDCFVSGPPVTINGGQSNPNPAMRVANISRSDSIVTVPMFDYLIAANNPCPGGVCGTATVTGFLQLGIQSVGLVPGPRRQGKIGAVILNASGCDPAAAGNPPVSGGGVAPVPVRLTR
jgi:hypothetical protein